MFELFETWLNRETLEFLIQGADLRLAFYIGIFVGGLMLWEGVRQMLSRDDDSREVGSRRMKMLRAGKTTEEVLQALKPIDAKGPLSRIPIFGNLDAELKQAGMETPPGLILIATAVTALACANM